MSEIHVMDSSAVLALLQSEKGQEVVRAALLAPIKWISSVNYCEILSKLCERGMPTELAVQAIDNLQINLIPFDRDNALRVAELRLKTKMIGASLGDRACLALAGQAVESGSTATVVTAELAWKKISWPFKLQLIR